MPHTTIHLCKSKSSPTVDHFLSVIPALASFSGFFCACATSGVTPEEGLVVQHTGQFMVERLMKFPEEVSGGWKHRTKVPVCRTPGVRHWTFGQRCLHLL